MNYILIGGLIILIVVISLVAYFMLGKKEGIKDGKYTTGRLPYDFIIKGDTLILEPKSDSGKQRTETKIIKTDINAGINIDGKQQFFYKTQNMIDGTQLYISQTQDKVILVTDNTSDSYSGFRLEIQP